MFPNAERPRAQESAPNRAHDSERVSEAQSAHATPRVAPTVRALCAHLLSIYKQISCQKGAGDAVFLVEVS